MPAIFSKKQRFILATIVPLLKAIVWEPCLRFFSYVFDFCKIKVTVNEDISFTDNTSGIRLPDCSKLLVNWKNVNDVTILRQDVIVKIFWHCFIFLVNFSCCSKFHVNIITSSGVMTITFYKTLTRNLEIGNTPVWVLPNVWRLGQVKNTKFGTN